MPINTRGPVLDRAPRVRHFRGVKGEEDDPKASRSNMAFVVGVGTGAGLVGGAKYSAVMIRRD